MNKKSILIWDILSLIFIIGAPLVTCIVLEVWPDGGQLAKSMLPIAILFYPAAIFSAFPYISTIGIYGTYLSFLTGNVSNIKVPCALNAIGSLDDGCSQTHKDCMVTGAVAVSNIVTLIVLTICVFGLLPYMDDIMDLKIAPAFRQILAALFGALGVHYFKKNKLFSTILIIGLIVALVIDGTLSSTILLIIAMGIMVAYSIVASVVEYNKTTNEDKKGNYENSGE